MKNHYRKFAINNNDVITRAVDQNLRSALAFGILVASIIFAPKIVEAASVKQSASKEMASTQNNNKPTNDLNQDTEIPEYPNPFAQISKEMDRLWHKIAIKDNSSYFIDGGFVSSSFHSYLNTTDKEYILNIEIPGFEKEQVKIELQGNYILVKAQKPVIETSKNDPSCSNSQARNSFYQKLLLPKDVDKTEISSNLKNGILTITLPKSPLKTEEVKIIPIS